MYVPHISQRDDALLYQIPQKLNRRTGAASCTGAAMRRQERAYWVGMQGLRIPLARNGGRDGCWHVHEDGECSGCRSCWVFLLLRLLWLCGMQGKGWVNQSGGA
jgi:hypothetical protein